MTSGALPGRARVLVLSGATATGKTDLALALAERWPVDIVSADAAQVFRGMDVGTAKPSSTVLARVPHRLVDIRDPHESYSAAAFCHDARRAIDDIIARGRLPLVVGGTLFYIRALIGGLSELPQADSALRASILEEARARGWAAMHAELARADPVLAGRIEPGDRQRLQRAVEIYRLTGRPPSAVMAGARPRPLAHPYVHVGLFHPRRDILHDRIARRFRDMVGGGLLEEVARIRRDPRVRADSVSMRTVGYRQAWQHLDGVLGRDAFVEAAAAATRQLAKRQLTWLRHTPGVVWLDASHPRRLETMSTYIGHRVSIAPEESSKTG